MYELGSLRPVVRSQIKKANLPIRSLGLEFSDLKPYKGENDPITAAKSWVNAVIKQDVIKSDHHKLCGLGLLFVGKPGHGKTTLASVIAQELIKDMPQDGWGPYISTRPVYFTDYPKLMRMKQRTWSDEEGTEDYLIDCIWGEGNERDNVKVLILDDLGKEYRTQSGWSENQFDQLLRNRFNSGLPTIITTNVSVKDWSSVYGESMESFVHEACLSFEIISEHGGDRRK